MTVNNIGHAQDNTNASYTLAATVPAGATIVVGAHENLFSAFTNGQVTDSAGNAYVMEKAQVTGPGGTGIWVCENCLALSGNITFTKGGAASEATFFSAAYITAIGAFDSAATGSNTISTGTSLATTSGTPAVAGETFLAFVGTNSTTGTLTNDATWSSPPFDNVHQSSPANVSTGGFKVNASASTVTYSVTISAAAAIGAIIVGFKPPAGAGGFNMPMLGF